MTSVVYLNKPSIEIVLDLINLQSTVPIDLVDVTFGTPISVIPETLPLINRNTRLTLKGSDNNRFTNERTVYYNRLNINTLFKVTDVGIPEAPVDLTDAVRLLNQYYGLALTTEEVYPSTVVDGVIELKISQSLVYEPESFIRLVSNSDLTWFENAVDRYYFYVNTTLPQAIGISPATPL